ncbi:aspartate-semialdehyde dehydrogenase [Eubacteriales bacterium OttesenSCG-928-K08]|nr:aspartate-semialdehyde dehydrogenase [Eubacteriales bacterium OttesenSCG-928-K08]
MKQYNVAVVGATGMVGRKFLQVLEERKLPVANYYLFASKRSAGTKLPFMGKEYVVRELTETCFDGLDIHIALFSAGGGTSKEFAPVAARAGAVVIDNSSQWRMDEDVPLVVPEVNPEHIPQYKKKGIIANPNCSTIQAVVALKPLHEKFGLKRVVYSTYQAVSGAGQQGYSDLEQGILGHPPSKFQHQIAGNCLPHIDVFLDTGYTKEEQKMIDETRKILDRPELRVTATTVRVPVFHGHSESINVELERPFEMAEIFEAFESMPGIVVQDDPANALYPMPITAQDTDPVYVGRIRRDFSVDNGINFWCVADNIRKGAATNTVQIAQELINQWER